MQTLLRTPLFDRHVALGATDGPVRRVGDAGAVRGRDPEHMAVRTDSGVFDVSHMGELEVEGPRATTNSCSHVLRTTLGGWRTGRRNTPC
jgi:aminomethyltransferase